MYVLNHGIQYAIFAPYLQWIINYKADMEFVYDGKQGAYQPHVVRGPAVPPPPATTIVGTSAASPAPSPTVHLLLLLREGMHLQLLLSHLMLLLVGPRSRTSSSQASKLSSPCATPTTLSSMSLIST
jgi:hypothetical protein